MAETLASSAEHQAILSCLGRIRLRLYAVRLGERVALAVAYGAVMALFFTGARLLMDRFLVLALLTAGVPLAGAGYLWMHAALLAGPGSTLSRNAGLTPMLLKVAAVLTAAVTVAAIGAFAFGVHLPVWAYPVNTVSVFVVAAMASIRPVNPSSAAIFVDQHVGLKERVSTALEFFETRPASELESAFRAPVIASALAACTTVHQAKVGYRRVDSRIYPLAATVAIAAAAVCLVPPMTVQATATHRSYVTMVPQGKALAEKIKELERNQKLMEDPKAKEAMAKLHDLSDKMAKGEVSPFEAGERMESALSGLKGDDPKTQAASELEKMFKKDFGKLAQAGDELKKATAAGDKGDPNAPAQQQAARDNISKAAGAMGEKLGGMSESEKKELGDKLDKAAQEASGDPGLKGALESAADAARKGDGQKLSESMAEASSRASETSGHQASQDELRESLQRIAQAESGGRSAGEQQASAQSGGSTGNQGGEQPQGEEGGSGSEQNGGSSANSGQNEKGPGEPGGKQPGGRPGEGGSDGTQTASADGSGGDNDKGEGTGGSTNLHAPSGPGGEQKGGPVGRQTTYVRIYDEKKVDSKGDPMRAHGKINPLAPSASVEIRGAADKGDSMVKEYESILPEVKKKAMDDLQTQQIPPQYRDLIKGFYE